MKRIHIKYNALGEGIMDCQGFKDFKCLVRIRIFDKAYMVFQLLKLTLIY